MEDNSVAAGAAPLKAGHTPTAKMLLRYAGLARKRKLILGENFIATLTNAAALLSCVEEVRKEERERCARIIEEKHTNNVGMVHPMAQSDAAAIRSLPSPPSL